MGVKGWYNLSVISGKQVKILYGPAAVRHIKNRLCPITANRGQAIGSFPEKARRPVPKSKYPYDKSLLL